MPPFDPNKLDTQQRSDLLGAATNELFSRLDKPKEETSPIEAPTERVSRVQSAPVRPIKQPQTTEEVQRDLMRNAQGEINSLNDYYNQLRAQQEQVNAGRSRETQSVNTLTGLAGSTEANQTTAKTNATNKKALDLIAAEEQAQIQSVIGNVSSAAVEEAQSQREEFRLDTEAAETQRVQRSEEAMQNAQLLATGGATAEGYAQTDPDGYQYLVDKVGGEEILKSIFTLNRPKESILDKRIEGGKYIVAYENPLDGKVRVETVDLGLPTGYSKTIDAGNRILAVPDNWSGDPSELVTINKGLTPGQLQSSTSSTSNTRQGAFTNDLDALVSNVFNIIPSENGKEAYGESISRARDDADKINTIATVALRNSPGEVRNDFIKQAQGIRSIDKAISQLDKGVQTGVLQNGAQYLFNIVGKDYDPELQTIAANITAAIQPYRSSVTGAAWGDQEDAEYLNLFGSTKFDPPALRQRLENIKNILMEKSTSALSTQITPFGGTDIFSYSTQPTSIPGADTAGGETFELDGVTYVQGADGKYYEQ